MTRRVVITGMGMVSPLGQSVSESWENIKAGKCGIGPITRFDVSAFAVRIGGQVRGFEVGTYISPKEARRMDLKSLGEPQGEAVAFGPSDTVYIAGEGGGRSQPGTLAALSCPT